MLLEKIHKLKPSSTTTMEATALEKFDESQKKVYYFDRIIEKEIKSLKKYRRHQPQRDATRRVLVDQNRELNAHRNLLVLRYDQGRVEAREIREQQDDAASRGQVWDGPEPWDYDNYIHLILHLDRADRRLRHELNGIPIFPLPEIDLPLIPHYRSLAVSRVCWLTARDMLHEPRFPNKWCNRFDTRDFIVLPAPQRAFFRSNVPWIILWMVEGDFNVPVGGEDWSAVFQIVGMATEFEMSWLGKLMKAYANEVNQNAIERVGEFTQPAAVDGECPICGNDFGDQNFKDQEPAVKTICGHYIGKDCLQSWADMSIAAGKAHEVTCPSCRTALFIGIFPVRAQANICKLMDYLGSDRALAEEVDSFLLKGIWSSLVFRCYGTKLEVMLNKLQRWTETAKAMFDECVL
ncbi:hypothetical protein BDU57DRAFT_535950 [Ampelomyces quisqualis]|uniref:RING-type domain-containing protein n=1 Tax=Ampelomyces quisqualis TaxID=50730 RepID=A0A6A5QSZ7_AMPQU|nr:hypothetical protein BDU57DRAFT_535950 [Ampelomyces quisqualis]